MTYNRCRNGAVTLLAALGVPHRIAMEILGHSTISTTMNICARVASESMKKAIEKLESKLCWETVVYTLKRTPESIIVVRLRKTDNQGVLAYMRP
jgi:hypothetical protein